jgi:hypothetical protein
MTISTAPFFFFIILLTGSFPGAQAQLATAVVGNYKVVGGNYIIRGNGYLIHVILYRATSHRWRGV